MIIFEVLIGVWVHFEVINNGGLMNHVSKDDENCTWLNSSISKMVLLESFGT
jgi:hypothetical protein